jgi:hypothetical protein
VQPLTSGKAEPIGRAHERQGVGALDSPA